MKLTYWLYSLLICLGLLTLGSCSDGDDYTSPVTQTVFVFFPYANNLTTDPDYLTKDLAEIKTGIKNSGNMNSYRAIVYYGNSANTAHLFEYRLNNGVIEEQPIESYTDVNQTSEDYLAGVFSKVRETSPTSTYKMIIGGHGCGWLPSTLYYGNVNKVIRKSFGGCDYDDGPSTVRINTTTFANAMSRAALRPDLIIFDACLMANIETLYDLRSSAKYIIAPPSEQVAVGFQYDNIWPNIIAESTLSNLQSLCDKYKSYYDSNIECKTSSGTFGSPANMAIINCETINGVAEAMKLINTDAVASENIKTLSIDDIQRYDIKEEGVFYDIKSYAYAILQPETYPQGKVLFDKLNTAVQSAVPYFVHSGYYFASPYIYPLSTTNTCGLATSDPSVNTSVTPYKESTTWWKATH